MSMMYCEHCDRMIDTDHDAEHFTDEPHQVCIELVKDEADNYHNQDGKN